MNYRAIWLQWAVGIIFILLNSQVLALNDAIIAEKINSAFKIDTITKPYNIAISVKNGVVILDGIVHTIQEAATAVQLAQATDDVKDVNPANLEFQLPSSLYAPDVFITAKIKGLLIREKLFTPATIEQQISVQTHDGVVFLSGKATNHATIERMISIAASVNGVIKVVPQLTVKYKIIQRKETDHG